MCKKIIIGSTFFFLLFFWSNAWGTTYYVDYLGGSDDNSGTSTLAPFKHCPGDSNATDTAASTAFSPGDIIYFKKGVTYRGTIVNWQSGAITASGTDATINSSGVLTDTSANFSSVTNNQYVYIYFAPRSGCNEDSWDCMTNTWVESTGFYEISAVDDSRHTITLSGFTGPGHATAEVTYVAVNPITYTSKSDWGSGDAVLSGDINSDGDNFDAGDADIIFNLTGRSCIMYKDLKFTLTKMRQYTYGTVSINNGSKIVTGTNTYWLKNSWVKAGDSLEVREEDSRTISSIDSDTQITLTSAFSGNRTNEPYRIYNDTSWNAKTRAAIYDDNDSADYIFVINCKFYQMGARAFMGLDDYCVIKGNNSQGVDGYGLGEIDQSGLIENNTVTWIESIPIYPTRTCQAHRASIIRCNIFSHVNRSWLGMHSDGIGFIDGGENGENTFGWIYDNTIDDTQIGIALYGSGGGVQRWVVANNLFIGHVDDPNYLGDEYRAISFMGRHLKIYNNVFYAADSGRGWPAIIELEEQQMANPGYIDLKNNIFYTGLGSGQPFIVFCSTCQTGNDSDYNHFYTTAGSTPPIADWGGSNRSLSYWQGTLGFDTHGIHATYDLTKNPNFVNPPSNFQLNPGSPDLNAGTSLSSYLQTDKLGIVRTNVFSLGAYEYEYIQISSPKNFRFQ